MSRMVGLRAGHSLIELLVVMTLVGLALTSVGTTMVTLSRVDRSLREHQQRSEQWGRLAYRFRSDVRAAVAAASSLGDANRVQSDSLKLDLGRSRSIEYRGESGRIERVVREGEQIVHRDSFRLGRRQFAAFEQVAGSGHAPWVLSIATEVADGGQREGSLRIEATLGTHANPRPRRSQPNRRRQRVARRRGAVLAAALLCFLVVTLFAAAVAYRVALTGRHLRTGRFAAQAEWLAESGAQRAKAQLAASAEFTGETWNVAASEFGAADAGRSGAVVIAVTRDDDDSTVRRVVVSASYPADSIVAVVRRLEFDWKIAGPTEPVNE